jgi:hypothetical protein
MGSISDCLATPASWDTCTTGKVRDDWQYVYLRFRSRYACVGKQQQQQLPVLSIGNKNAFIAIMPLLGREKGRSPRSRRSEDEFVVFLQGVSSSTFEVVQN